MSQGKLFEQVLDPTNRHNPYPLYAELRKTPVSQQEDGTYVVSTYSERNIGFKGQEAFFRYTESGNHQ
jgi:hypothetical protein